MSRNRRQPAWLSWAPSVVLFFLGMIFHEQIFALMGAN